jgi:8-oxo-dGTP pyrophosphatase MutT (NUDIX family)
MAAVVFPAATVVVVRNATAGGVEVYMVRRPDRSSFLSGAHVFPGGRVEPQDEDPAWEERCGVAGWERPPGTFLAHAVAVVRELFEEAGLLLVQDASGAMPGGDHLDERAVRAREQLIEGTSTFLEACRSNGWWPAVDRLAPLSRWITPEMERRRFDTVFYVASAPAGQVACIDNREAVAGAWFRPQQAVSEHLAGTMSLAPPTLRTLEDLADVATADEAIARAWREPFRTIAPRLFVERGVRRLLLPGDVLYPVDASAALRPPTRFVLDAGRGRSEAATSDEARESG